MKKYVKTNSSGNNRGNDNKSTSSTTMATVPNNMVVVSQEEDVNTKYVVVRDGFLVSENRYNNPEDPDAKSELNFWKGIARKSKDGTVVKIVKFDDKIHKTV
jgi:hypothetical protein